MCVVRAEQAVHAERAVRVVRAERAVHAERAARAGDTRCRGAILSRGRSKGELTQSYAEMATHLPDIVDAGTKLLLSRDAAVTGGPEADA